MTETVSAHTMLPPGRLLEPERSEACGHALPGITVKIVDEATRQPLGANEVGEVLMRGYSLMQGLYKKERDQTFTADGFYATGDLGALDEDGFFTFSHRVGEMLKVHGANVAPAEVENTLNALHQIERCAVVGLPTTDGVLLVAAVQIRASETFDEAQIREELRTRLSSFKVPRRIFVLAAEEMPVTGSGKIRKPDLVLLLAERLRAEASA
jgi:acyl-CoA synthetase (AMP-forming)/AMP-acid ligase II